LTRPNPTPRLDRILFLAKLTKEDHDELDDMLDEWWNDGHLKGMREGARYMRHRAFWRLLLVVACSAFGAFVGGFLVGLFRGWAS